MKCIVKRTTTSMGKDNIYYFVKITPIGPMFNTRNMALEFDSVSAAEQFIDDNLANLDGTFDIVQISK